MPAPLPFACTSQHVFKQVLGLGMHSVIIVEGQLYDSQD